MKTIKQYASPILLIIIIIVLGYRINKENSIDYIIASQEYKNQETQFYNNLKNIAAKNLDNSGQKKEFANYQIKTAGQTASNFEGPQVHIYGFMYGDSTYLLNDYVKKPNKKFDLFKISKVIFDPDHPRFNSPDIEVSVKQPSVYKKKSEWKGEEQALKNLKTGNYDSPYMTVTKKYFKIEADSTLSSGNINIDVWLTQFEIDLQCVPFRGANGNKPDGCSSEKSAYRHGNFKILLRLIPNYAPWYTSDRGAFDEKPDIAIGGVFCSKIDKFGSKINCEINREGYQLPLEANNFIDFNSSQLLSLAGDTRIWNRPDTVSIFLNNFGTYALQSPDRVTYKFIMPVLVKGKWGVKLPSEFFTEVIKERRSIFGRGFSFIPKWGSTIGSFFSYILYGLLIILAIRILLPTLVKTLLDLLIGRK